MARIAFLSLPQFGHVNPHLAIVAELIRRGHEVTFFNEPAYSAGAARLGARCVATPPAMSDPGFVEALTEGDLVRWIDLWLNATSVMLGSILETLEPDPPDLIVFDGMDVWGEMAATRLRLPSVSISTAFIFTALDDPTGKRPPIGRWALNTLQRLPSFVGAWLKMAKYGARNLPWRMPFVPRRGTLTLVLTSRELHPATPLADDPRFAFVGPCIEPGARTESFDFSRLDGRPLIYVSLGTVLFTNRRFFEACIAAFHDFPGQVLLSVGPGTDLSRFAEAPANFIFAEALPQLEVLQRTSVFVTHAGLNSLQEALWFGVPMVAAPMTPEQARNAAIAAKAGAAVTLDDEARGDAIGAEALRAAVDRVLADPTFPERAKALGQSLRAAGGTPRAVDHIERVIAASRTGKSNKHGILPIKHAT
jgi:MGT family glycosyltransferase